MPRWGRENAGGRGGLGAEHSPGAGVLSGVATPTPRAEDPDQARLTVLPSFCRCYRQNTGAVSHTGGTRPVTSTISTETQSPLRRELGALGWNCEQLISRVNQRRRRRGAPALHSKSAYPWARGGRPAADVRADVLAVLSEHAGRPVTAAQMQWDKRRAHTGAKMRALENPYSAGAFDLVRETQGEPMERRSFGLLTGAAITAAAMDLLMSGAPAMAAAQNGDRVSPQLATNIEHAVRQARELDDSEGSASVLRWAGGIWQNLGNLLTESVYRQAEGARLHTAYVEMSETYGWMLFDAGKHPQSQRVFQTGLRVAREAEDDVRVHQATANLLASAAYQATWLGQHAEAATMLDVAVNRKPKALTPRVQAVLAARRTYLAGRQGDTQAIYRAEDVARTQLGKALDGDGPWWSTWLGPKSIDGQTGRAWLFAGQPDRAEPYLVSGAVGSLYPRDRMLLATELADARIQTGDINGASTATRQALELSGSIGSNRVGTRLQQIITTLSERHSSQPAVRQLLAGPPYAV
jgi:hypothetical protein